MNVSNGRILLLLYFCQQIRRHIHEGNFCFRGWKSKPSKRDEVLKKLKPGCPFFFVWFADWQWILCFKDTNLNWFSNHFVETLLYVPLWPKTPDLCISIMACDPTSPWWELSGVKVCFFSNNSSQETEVKNMWGRNSIYCHISLRKKMGQHFFLRNLWKMSNCYNFLGQRSRKKPFNFPSVHRGFPCSLPHGFSSKSWGIHLIDSQASWCPRPWGLMGEIFGDVEWPCSSGGGQLKYVVYVHPYFWGKIFNIFDKHIFQRGWFNHQLEFLLILEWNFQKGF